MSVSSVNRRSVFAVRTIGCDRSDLVRFCGVMDLPPPVHNSSCKKVNKPIDNAAVEVHARCRQIRVRVGKQKKDTVLPDIDVSSDGTWMTPGHSSTVGVATTVGCVTGKALGGWHKE